MARSRPSPELDRLLQRQHRVVAAAVARFGRPGTIRRPTAQDRRDALGLVCDLARVVEDLSERLAATGRETGRAVEGLNASLAYLIVGRAVATPRRRSDA